MTPVRVRDHYDWGAILGLLQASFAYMDGRIDPPSSLHRMTREDIADFAARERLVVIEVDARPVACVFLSLQDDAVYIGKFAVADRFRGQGLARMLLDDAETFARARRRQVIRLQTRIEIAENHKIFKALGFEITGSTRHPGFDRPTSLTMEKRI